MNLMNTVKEYHQAFGITSDIEVTGMTLVTFQDILKSRLDILNEDSTSLVEGMGRLNQELIKGAEDILDDFHKGVDASPASEYYNEEVISVAKQAILKSMASSVLALAGTADILGLDLDEAVKLVHASAMGNLDDDGKPVISDGTYGIAIGKAMKTDNYVEPDLSSCI